MDLFGILLIVYCGITILNILLIKIFKVFDEDTNYWFCLVYAILSPLTVLHTIGRIFDTWYSVLEHRQIAAEAIMIAFEENEVKLASMKEAEKIMRFISDNEIVSEFEGFDELIDYLMDNGKLVKLDDSDEYIVIEK